MGSAQSPSSFHPPWTRNSRIYYSRPGWECTTFGRNDGAEKNDENLANYQKVCTSRTKYFSHKPRNISSFSSVIWSDFGGSSSQTTTSIGNTKICGLIETARIFGSRGRSTWNSSLPPWLIPLNCTEPLIPNSTIEENITINSATTHGSSRTSHKVADNLLTR